MNPLTKWKLVRIVFTAITLFIGWILFTGTLSASSLAIGSLLSLLIAAATYKLFIHETEAERRSMLPRVHLFIFFALLIIFKMYVASFKVVFHILRGEINPRVVHFRTRLKSDMARVMLTNAITLTPGTITLALDDDHLIVHWLNANTIHSKHAGLQIKGQFERLLGKIWI